MAKDIRRVGAQDDCKLGREHRTRPVVDVSGNAVCPACGSLRIATSLRRRSLLLMLSTGLATMPMMALAQTRRTFRIGVLSTQTAATAKRYLDTFLQDLHQLG
jgi:hypothetical protein